MSASLHKSVISTGGEAEAERPPVFRPVKPTIRKHRLQCFSNRQNVGSYAILAPDLRTSIYRVLALEGLKANLLMVYSEPTRVWRHERLPPQICHLDRRRSRSGETPVFVQ